MVKDSISFGGYGQGNLLEVLRKAPWTPCVGGENFSAIVVGGCYLTKPSDAICNAKYRVTLKNLTTCEFTVFEGYSFPNVILNINVGMGENTINGEVLKQFPALGLIAYRVDVALIV